LQYKDCCHLFRLTVIGFLSYRFPVSSFKLIIIRDVSRLSEQLRGGAVTIGNFDGVHRGHACIVSRLIEQARAVGGPAVVFTFEPAPVQILRPREAPPPLTWTERKAQLLGQLGADALIAYPTDEALLSLSAREFFTEIVQRQLAARAVVEGPNFFFGRGRAGDVAVLDRLCTQSEVRLEIVSPLQDDGQIISSSRIRALVAAGDVAAAARLLTQPYRIRGMVIHGAGRGAKIGFPTANVDAIDTLLPKPGVYAGRAYLDDHVGPTAVNIGPNPTFGERSLKVEAHLIGFSGAIYGSPIEVDFLSRVRDIHPFGSVEQLKQQLARDVEQVEQEAADCDKT
jgi:riboflavin kinase/FMN adenylyltransferase